MSNMETDNLEKLQCAFPKLTEANQSYIVGLVEGLKHAQDKTADIGAAEESGNQDQQ